MKAAASPRSMKRSQLFWHSLSHIRRFSPLRMTKRGDARRSGEQVSHWWFSGIGLLSVNDKDFLLALEMTIRESLMSLSLWIASD